MKKKRKKAMGKKSNEFRYEGIGLVVEEVTLKINVS